MSPKIRVSFLDEGGHSFALIELEVADDFRGNTNQAASGYIERYLANNFDEPVWEEMRQAYLAGRWEFHNVSEPVLPSTAAQSVSTAPAAPVETKCSEPIKILVSFLNYDSLPFEYQELDLPVEYLDDVGLYLNQYLQENPNHNNWLQMCSAVQEGRWQYEEVNGRNALNKLYPAPRVETKQKESKPTDFNQEDKPMEKIDLAHLVDQIRRAYAPQMEQLQNLNYRIQEKTELAEKLMQEADALTTEREQLKDSLKYFASIISPFIEDLHSLTSSILSATEAGGEDA